MTPSKITKSAFLILSIVLYGFAFSGCLGKTSDTGTGTNDTNNNTTTPKATLSRWYVSNRAWSVDLSNGNKTGSTFTGQFIYSDSSYCNCTFTMTGSESSGTYTATGCTSPVCPSSAMACSGSCSDFNTSTSPSYSNSGSALKLCYSGASCLSYYP
jgi:hypothetical protein